MRGKVVCRLVHIPRSRITPAYAGKSYYAIYDRAAKRDHPRICGEKPHQAGNGTNQDGITPAYAGKRQDGRLDKLEEWDHPRICGEKTKKIP